MHQQAPRWSPARLAYAFYTVAATGAVIGQTWVAYTHIPWAAALPAWARIAAVLPFTLCLELLAMALAAMADERLRLGERAYGFRVFSTLVAAVAVAILILGHWPHYYWSASFGILSTSAYLLWLLHSAARRRDALRAAGKLADTAPDYGLWRRLRHPIWTARAAELARQGRIGPATAAWRPLSLHESLHAARLAIRADKRRPALAHAVERVVRGDHDDPRMADIAVHTLDLDQLATHLETLVNYPAWANRLAPAITVPTADPAPASRPAPELRQATTRHRRRVLRHHTGAPPRRSSTTARETGAHAVAPATPTPSPANHTVNKPTRATPKHQPADDSGAIADANNGAAQAVAYWRQRHPQLHPRDIAARIGKSERHVRRIIAALNKPEPTSHAH